MSKRRMPPHIVLPNGMWRFVKKGTKTRTRKARAHRVKVRSKRRVFSMARRKRHYGRARSMLGASGGLVRPALFGIGTAHLSGYIPFDMPYKEEMAGAIGAYLMGGKNIKSAAIGAAAVFLTKMAGGTAVAQSGGRVY